MTYNSPHPTRDPLRRMGGLIHKEFLQIARDPSALLIALVVPVILLLLFGTGVSLDARNIPIALVVEEPTAESQNLVAAFSDSPFFRPTELRHRQEAEQGLIDGRFHAMLVVPGDFAARVARGEDAPLQLTLDGTDANTARLARGYVEGAWSRWLQLEAQGSGQSALQSLQPTPSVGAESRIWFNPQLLSRNFLVPGLIAIIMTLTGTLLTSLVVAREWERGTMEALLATPVERGELLVSKLLPYFVLGMGGMVIALLLAVFVFDVPMRGSLWLILATSALFLIGALAMGLLISTIARNQFVAGQIAIVAAFLPAFMLSGFVFEPSSMPHWVEALSYLVASRYFVTLLQTLFLAGDVWSVILPNSAALLAVAVFFLALTIRRTGKRLD